MTQRHSSKLLSEENSLSPGWFDEMVKKHQSSKGATIMREEVTALENFHRGESSVEETAYAITRPITESPVPAYPNSYDPGEVEVCNLWEIFRDALLDWPSHRIPDLIDLLIAISKVPDKLHLGQPLDDDGEVPKTWSEVFPNFRMVWFDSQWEEPEAIEQRTPDPAERASERALFIKRKDITIQLVTANILSRLHLVRFLVDTFEKQVHELGSPIAISFRIPIAAHWMKSHGAEVYTDLVEAGPRANEDSVLQFDSPDQRWSFWRGRFEEIAKNGPDELTRTEAAAGAGYMESARKRA